MPQRATALLRTAEQGDTSPNDQAETGEARTRRRSGVSPLHLGLLAAMIGLFWLEVTPINDLDSYWHVLIGQQIVQTHSLDHLGTSWLGVPAPHWQTSQWLSEVAIYGIVHHLGWRALIVVRLLMLAAICTSVIFTIVRRMPALTAVPVTLLVLVSLVGLVQDRPQTASLIFLPWLAYFCQRLWTVGTRPPLLAIAAGSLLLGPAPWAVDPRAGRLRPGGPGESPRAAGPEGAAHAGDPPDDRGQPRGPDQPQRPDVVPPARSLPVRRRAHRRVGADDAGPDLHDSVGDPAHRHGHRMDGVQDSGVRARRFSGSWCGAPSDSLPSATWFPARC